MKVSQESKAFFSEEKKQKTFDINRLKLHDDTRQSGHPSAKRTSNGFTREAQKKSFASFLQKRRPSPAYYFQNLKSFFVGKRNCLFNLRVM